MRKESVFRRAATKVHKDIKTQWNGGKQGRGRKRAQSGSMMQDEKGQERGRRCSVFGSGAAQEADGGPYRVAMAQPQAEIVPLEQRDKHDQVNKGKLANGWISVDHFAQEVICGRADTLKAPAEGKRGRGKVPRAFEGEGMHCVRRKV